MNVENIINSIEQNAAENIKIKAGDYYGDDGLLVCGKCNTPKQVKVILFGKERTPYCLCKCETERREQEEAERKKHEQVKRITELRRMGFPNSEMQKWTFENDDKSNKHVMQIMQNYVENFDKMRENGKGLLLFGTVGTGKSFASACVVNALIDRGYPCLMTNFARLTNTVSGMYDGKQEYIDGLNRFSLLVIDDLASERDTEYMNEIVQNIIDSRYRAGLPLIITTNLTSEELKNSADIRKQRIYSRLFEMCLPIEVKGVDRRRQKLKSQFTEFKDILGL